MLNLLRDLTFVNYYIAHPAMLLMLAFQLWMLVDAIRRQEWVWAVFIFIGTSVTVLMAVSNIENCFGGLLGLIIWLRIWLRQSKGSMSGLFS